MNTTKTGKPGTSRSSRNRRSVSRSLRDTLAVVMAGGRGARLHTLTATRSKPAVAFAGKYRIIDFTLSNCINSGIRRISVLTQYRAHSLIQHLGRGWSFCRAEFGEFIEVLPAQERLETSSWYLGTADAVFQNLDIIQEHRPAYVLVLAGDHVYKMDYGMMMAAHLERNADVTIGCVEVPLATASEFGLMLVDDNFRVVGFQEKPAEPQPMPGRSDVALASMGIYLFSYEFLVDVLRRDHEKRDSSHDFGKDIMPAIHRSAQLLACPFNDLSSGEQGYWRDVGTIDAYWQANLELVDITPPLNLYEEDWPIRTYQAQLPPAKFVFDQEGRRGMAVDSVVSAGCIVSGAYVRHSLISNNVRVNDNSVLEDCVVLPNVLIGRNCHLRRAVIDTGCTIPDDTRIGLDAAADAERYYMSPGGVVLVSPEMLGQPVSHVI